jgi:hypothetical protein
MDVLSTVAIAMGASWASGIRLYACVATLGLLHRYGYTQLPGELEILAHPGIIWTSTALFVIEFFVDKIPYLDTVWDTIHTFIRIPSGFVLAATAFTEFQPHIVVIAGLIGGTIAFGSHGLKTGTRVAINHSPEPVSNVVASSGEEVLGIGVPFLSIFAPILVIGFVAVLTITALILLPRIIRFLKRPLLRKDKS